MPSPIVITGDRYTELSLIRISERAENQTEAMRDAAQIAAHDVKGIPVDTGRLERPHYGYGEGYIEAWSDGFVLGTHVRYARFVFRGTERTPPRPPEITRAAILDITYELKLGLGLRL